MSFKPEPTKQTKEVIFARKTSKKIHPKIFLKKIVTPIGISNANSQKHQIRF